MKKTCVVSIRVLRAEFDAAQVAAEVAGQSVSDFVRGAVQRRMRAGSTVVTTSANTSPTPAIVQYNPPCSFTSADNYPISSLLWQFIQEDGTR